jgi:hypothetical protein
VIWRYKSQTSTAKLRSLLAQQKWEEANRYTSHIILFVVGRKVRRNIAFPDKWNRVIRKLFLKPIFQLIHFPITSTDLMNRLTLYVGSFTFELDELDRFPCDILHEIDQLWTTYSNGHFGFSVQMSIYEEIKQKNSLPLPFSSNVNISSEFIPITSVDYSLISIKDTNILSLIEKLQWSEYNPDTDSCRGFRYSNKFQYNLKAPKGHLPFLFNYDQDVDFLPYMNYLNMPNMVTLWNRYNLKAPKGHLPFLFNYDQDVDFLPYMNYLNMPNMVTLWNRLKNCKY